MGVGDCINGHGRCDCINAMGVGDWPWALVIVSMDMGVGDCTRVQVLPSDWSAAPVRSVNHVGRVNHVGNVPIRDMSRGEGFAVGVVAGVAVGVGRVPVRNMSRANQAYVSVEGLGGRPRGRRRGWVGGKLGGWCRIGGLR